MTRMLARAKTTVFAVSTGVALVFGATAARADVNTASACADPFANGTCTTTDQCAKYCRGVVGAGTGQCTSGCCYCIWF